MANRRFIDLSMEVFKGMIVYPGVTPPFIGEFYSHEEFAKITGTDKFGITHCNAGSLATSEYGTALAPVYTAKEDGKVIRVYADETRPLLQGSRLTAWELMQEDIDVTVVCDNTAAQLMKEGRIDAVLVGADRIAANGDTANKIGTYSLAVLANQHEVPFTVAAPWSSVDLRTRSGADIPIEERSRDEVARIGGTTVVADGIPCRHPAFDITPARLVDAIYTERGVVRPKIGERPDVLQGEPFGSR